MYHFRITVVENNQTATNSFSYCNLKTEIAVWAYNPPLSQITAWMTVALTAVCSVLLLFGAFLLYSYFYSSDNS